MQQEQDELLIEDFFTISVLQSEPTQWTTQKNPLDISYWVTSSAAPSDIILYRVPGADGTDTQLVPKMWNVSDPTASSWPMGVSVPEQRMRLFEVGGGGAPVEVAGDVYLPISSELFTQAREQDLALEVWNLAVGSNRWEQIGDTPIPAGERLVKARVEHAGRFGVTASPTLFSSVELARGTEQCPGALLVRPQLQGDPTEVPTARMNGA
ncbi:MAG: hypothetical protein ACO3JL_22030, partial [Myxococcota bacterium]